MKSRVDGGGSSGGGLLAALLPATALDALHVLKTVPRAAASLPFRGIAEGRVGRASLRERGRGRGREGAQVVSVIMTLYRSR